MSITDHQRALEYSFFEAVLFSFQAFFMIKFEASAVFHRSMSLFGFSAHVHNSKNYVRTDMPESLLLYVLWPSPWLIDKDEGEDEESGDDEEALCVRRMAPVALQ